MESPRSASSLGTGSSTESFGLPKEPLKPDNNLEKKSKKSTQVNAGVSYKVQGSASTNLQIKSTI